MMSDRVERLAEKRHCTSYTRMYLRPSVEHRLPMTINSLRGRVGVPCFVREDYDPLFKDCCAVLVDTHETWKLKM